MSNKAIVIYRMPDEEDYYTLSSENGLEVDSNTKNGFFFSDFNSGIIYEIKNPEIKKNNWPTVNFHFKTPESEISKDEYLKKVEEITHSIQSGEFKKVVFSRIKKIHTPTEFDIERVFKNLCDKYPKAFVYFISSKETGTWMGASPELLLNKIGESYKTVSLAGTRVNEVDWTEKEKKEQQVVTDYITRKITAFSSELKVSAPYDLNTGSVIHLKSDIQFKLDRNQSVWDLVKNLHPTPAVCGIPKEKSKQFIEQIESHKRGLYTGFIGSMEMNGHTSLFVNLRCMQIHEKSISLYLGGGIMGDSIPEHEWIETENKALTLLNII